MHLRHDGPSPRRKVQWSRLPKLADCTIDTSDVPRDVSDGQLRARHSLRYSEAGTDACVTRTRRPTRHHYRSSSSCHPCSQPTRLKTSRPGFGEGQCENPVTPQNVL